MLDYRRRIGAAVMAVAAFSVFDFGCAYAQEAIQEVIVTAQKKEENLQTIPIAISALTSDDLSKRGVTDFAGIAKASTSINFTPYPSSSNILILYMRGLGVADANQITQDGSVGLYEDGFYISRPQLATFDIADVERVEVLRGPQGTLYGRNTTGGAVNIISQKPSGELDLKGQLTVGSRGDIRALGTINLPKVSGFSMKITGLYSNLDGYVKNTGGEAFGIERQKAGRISVRYDDGGPFTADYFFEHGDIDSTPIYYEDAALNGLVSYPALSPTPSNIYNGSGQPNSVAWRPFNLPLSTGTNEAHGLTLNWAINDSTNLKSLTGYRTLHSDAFQDYADGFSNPATAPFTNYTDFNSHDIIDSHSFSQEFQLVGSVGKQIDYVVGLYYFKEGAQHLENGGIAIPGFPYCAVFGTGCAPDPFGGLTFNEQTHRYVTSNAKSQAAYFQGTWKPPVLDDKLSVTLGGRYTKDDRDATRIWTGVFVPVGIPAFAPELGGANHQSFTKFNPAGTISYAWNSDINTYVRVATGYKAGGSSEAVDPGHFGITYGPEELTQVEVGAKTYWFERRLRVNAAYFHSDVKDLQVSFTTNPLNLAYVLTENAGSATIDGLELEALFQPINDLTLGFNYTYLDAQIKDVPALAGTLLDPAVNSSSPYKVGQFATSVFRMPYAPKSIFNINADWTFAHLDKGALALQLNYRYQDRQYDSTPTGPAVPNATALYSIPGYGLLDARLTYNLDLENKKRFKVSAWVQNVTDTKYAQHVIGQGNIVPTTAFGPTGPYTQPAGYTYQAVAWAPKPLYGIDISYGF